MPKKGNTKKKQPKNAQEMEAFFKVYKGLDKSQKLFLSAYKSSLNISLACSKASISRQAFYDWKELRPEFRAAFEELQFAIDDEMQAYWTQHGRYDWRACQAWLDRREKAAKKEPENKPDSEAVNRNIISEPAPKRYEIE